MKIYKYPVHCGLAAPITLQGSILDIQVQNDLIFLWAEHNDQTPQRTILLRALFTGEEAPPDQNDFNYFKTVQIKNLVVHFYTK